MRDVMPVAERHGGNELPEEVPGVLLGQKQAVAFGVFVLVGDVAGQVAAQRDVHQDRQVLVRQAHLQQCGRTSAAVKQGCSRFY